MILRCLLAGLVSMVAIPAFAGGQCEGKADAHTGFCSDKTKQECKVHSGVCEWQDGTEKVVRVVAAEKCTSKPGKEAHEDFCSGHNKQICAVHSSLCVWR